ncbi:MAG TPA: guanylate kinase, partial [Caulobacteraceae bacterium]|nr:guanylate kinase [Caulobacteraceae bacterium]
EVIERRVEKAKSEIERWREYDYVVVNEDFDRSYAELAHIYHAERSRRPRNVWIEDYVGRLMDERV